MLNNSSVHQPPLLPPHPSSFRTFPPPPKRQRSNRPLPPRTTVTPIIPSLLPSYRGLISSSLPIHYPDKFYNLSTTQPAESGTIALCAVHEPLVRKTGANGGQAREARRVVGGIQARLEPYPLHASPSAQGGSVSGSGIGRDGRGEGQEGQRGQSDHRGREDTGRKDVQTREETEEQEERDYALYIQTLCTAPSHRTLGVATTLLNALVGTALTTDFHALTSPPTSRPMPCKLPNQPGPVEKNNVRIKVIYGHVWEANHDALVWYQARGFEAGEMVPQYYRKLRPAGARIVRRYIGVGDHLQTMMGGGGEINGKGVETKREDRLEEKC